MLKSQSAAALDCLLVHVGRRNRRVADTLIMPMGLPMLADQLEKAGFTARVLNYALYELHGGESLVELAGRLRPGMVAFDLQWYTQLPGVLKACRSLKSRFPGIKTVFGGFTASYFYREIMEYEPAADFILRGDAESTMPCLASALAGRGQLRDVPNLCWRNKGRISFNAFSCHASAGSLDDLYYANFRLVLNASQVLEGHWRCGLRGGKPVWKDEGVRAPKVFYNPGRGCPYNCSFCGGGASAQRRINGRGGYIFKSAASALRDLRGFLRAGARDIHICFDPDPDGAYYPRLFSAIRRSGLRFSMTFECWGLPSEAFIRAFAAAFRKDLHACRLVISPESGSERVRGLNKGLYYSNAELMAALRRATGVGIPCEISFAAALPFETPSDFAQTLRLAAAVRSAPLSETSISVIPVEPGAPLQERPWDYGSGGPRLDFLSFAAPRTLPEGGASKAGGLSPEIKMRAFRLAGKMKKS